MKRFFACFLFVLSVAVLPPGAKAQGDPFTTTRDYVAQFYPLWFTYYQTSFGNPNRMVGPNKISPIYHYVVAINNDTVYASSFLDLSMEPVIVTIPPTTANYSVLTLDRYCDIVPGIPNNTPGTYALYGPDFNPNNLPLTVERVPLPFNYMTIIFRADKFTKKGAEYVDMTAAAETFRRGLSTMPLCAYLGQSCPTGIPPGGPTRIVPEIEFVLPFKTIADSSIALDPIAFLRQLQRAVDSPKTPPMSQPVKALSDRFNSLFASRRARNRSEFARGARAAHHLIINEYLDHTGNTNWITYDNIGQWGTNPDPGSSIAVQRSEITQFIQYANDHDAAAYFHAFRDGDGLPLNGNDPHGYVLTFPPDKIPPTRRFWSLTAYTPEAIELVPNSINKYLVASYTPGLQTNADGSISIYIARRLPADVPAANWLPIPPGPFNVMLRDYGPLGSVLDGTYVPPEIERLH